MEYIIITAITPTKTFISDKISLLNTSFENYETKVQEIISKGGWMSFKVKGDEHLFSKGMIAQTVFKLTHIK